MTDREDNNTLGKIVFGNNEQERKLWVCLGKNCSRALIVFLSQLFKILLIIIGWFWRSHFLKTCDESTGCVGILCSPAGYFPTSLRL